VGVGQPGLGRGDPAVAGGDGRLRPLRLPFRPLQRDLRVAGRRGRLPHLALFVGVHPADGRRAQFRARAPAEDRRRRGGGSGAAAGGRLVRAGRDARASAPWSAGGDDADESPPPRRRWPLWRRCAGGAGGGASGGRASSNGRSRRCAGTADPGRRPPAIQLWIVHPSCASSRFEFRHLGVRG
jgi:hypothetical protein